MPAYNATPSGNNPVGLLQPGVPAFAFGSLNRNAPIVLANITQISADGTTATLTVIIREGFIPSVGDLITVVGSTLNGGAFNVSNVALSGVNITAATGIGTLQFLLAQTVSATADVGNAYVKVSAVPEAISNNEASKAFSISDAGGPNDNAKTISMQVDYPSGTNAPSTAVMTLQVSLVDNDSDYSDAISTSTTTTDLVEFPSQNVRFVRARVTGLTGAAPKATVRIAV